MKWVAHPSLFSGEGWVSTNLDHRTGVRFCRHGEARPLPAMRLFSLCHVQLLSAPAVVGHGEGLRVFESELEVVRARYGLVVSGFVLMPEHVHLLVGEPQRSSPGAPGPDFRTWETTNPTPPPIPRRSVPARVNPSSRLPPATPSFHQAKSPRRFADNFPLPPHNRTVEEKPTPSTRHKQADG